MSHVVSEISGERYLKLIVKAQGAGMRGDGTRRILLSAVPKPKARDI